jgi:hypothetical protein
MTSGDVASIIGVNKKVIILNPPWKSTILLITSDLTAYRVALLIIGAGPGVGQVDRYAALRSPTDRSAHNPYQRDFAVRVRVRVKPSPHILWFHCNVLANDLRNHGLLAGRLGPGFLSSFEHPADKRVRLWRTNRQKTLEKYLQATMESKLTGVRQE